MELQDDVVKRGALWLFVGLCGWVWSGVVREGWNMDRECTRDLLFMDMAENIFRIIFFAHIIGHESNYLRIVLELGYGSKVCFLSL